MSELELKIEKLIKDQILITESEAQDLATLICELPEIKGGRVGAVVMPDFTEITLSDYDKLGDTFIDAKIEPPLTQWRIIAGMLSSIGFKIIKKQ